MPCLIAAHDIDLDREAPGDKVCESSFSNAVSTAYKDSGSGVIGLGDEGV